MDKDKKAIKHAVMIAAPIHPIPPKRGAAVEWWMYQVGQRMHHCKMSLICIQGAEYPLYDRVEGMEIYRIHIGRLYKRLFQKWTRLDPYSYARRAASICRRIKAQIVHVHNDVKLFIQLRQYLPDTLMILHLHNEYEVKRLPLDVHLIVVSDYLRNYYRQRLPLAIIDKVTNGADYSAYPIPTAEPLGKKIPCDKKIILYAGRISPEKGVIELVNAFQCLCRARRDVVLIIAGEFSCVGDRAKYGQEIQRLCKQLGEACILLGVIDPIKMPQVFQIADLVVIPSRFEEPLGMVMLEAMAKAKPVLVANRGGMREVVQAGKTGFFIDDITESDQFAAQMGKLLESPAQLLAVGQCAQGYVKKYHSWHEVAKQLQQVYMTCESSVVRKNH